MALLSLYLRTAHQMLMIFAQMLEIVALSDLASVLCARKFLFAPQGVDPKLLPFHFHLLLFYYLWFPGLVRKGTYKFTLVRVCVRSSVRPFQSYSHDRSIFFCDFLHEVVSPYDLDDHQIFFSVEKFVDPQNSQKWSKFGHFWPK